MFTGIIDHTGVITTVIKTSKGLRFTIATQFNDLQLGESIAINGACFTVSDIVNNAFACDVSPETLKLTACNHYQEGTSVNLERSLRMGDRLGGHYVTGHIDRTAHIKRIIQHTDYVEMHIAGFDKTDANFLVTKGSLTVNGVSLTINSIAHSDVHLMLIPHTLTITNLKNLKIGDTVNIEFDFYTKTIAHQLALHMQHQELAHA